jgi:nitrogen regulatory protein P-II 1
MTYKKVTAIIQTIALGEVEKRLKDIGVKGMSAFNVMGYGEHTVPYTFDQNKMVQHVKIEIWAREDEVEKIVNAIMDAAHTGMPGDGLVTVLPVERLWRIRTKREATEDEI